MYFQIAEPLATHTHTHTSETRVLYWSLQAFKVGFRDNLHLSLSLISSLRRNSRVFDGMKVTGFKKSLNNCFHMPQMSFSLLNRAPFWSLIDLAVFVLLPQSETSNGLPEFFADLPITGI